MKTKREIAQELRKLASVSPHLGDAMREIADELYPQFGVRKKMTHVIVYKVRAEYSKSFDVGCSAEYDAAIDTFDCRLDDALAYAGSAHLRALGFHVESVRCIDADGSITAENER